MGWRLEQPVEVEVDALVRERFEPLDVGHRHPGRVLGAVAGREGVAVPLRQHDPDVLAILVDQQVVQVVGPVAHGGDDTGLEGFEVDRRTGAVLHDVVQPGQVRLGHPRLVGGAAPPQPVDQDRLDGEPGRGVVAVARQVHEHRPEAPEVVLAHEDACEAPLLELVDGQRGVVELVGADLHQLVARVRLEDGQQILVGVARRMEAGPRADELDLAAQDGNDRGAGRVHASCVQPDVASLADHPTVLVEALHAHVVEAGRPVHGGGGVGLGQHERGGVAGQTPRRGCQLRAGVRVVPGVVVVAQDAQAAGRDALHHGGAVLVGDLVAAHPEEGEVVAGQPPQELDRLRQFLVGHVSRCFGLEPGDGELEIVEHGLPVVDRGADVLEGGLDIGGELIGDRLGVPVDVDVDERLAVDDRVVQYVDAHAAGVDRHPDRIDDERHVVGDHLDRGVRRCPAVDVEARRHDAHRGLARSPVLTQPAVGQRRSVQVEDVASQQVFGGRAGVVSQQELGGCLSGPAGLALPGQVLQCLQHLRFQLVTATHRGCLPGG